MAKKKQHIENYIKEVFEDTIAGMVCRKYGSRLNDNEREQKAEELAEKIRLSSVPVYEKTKEITSEFLEQALDELERQYEGENVFGSPDYKGA